MTTLRHLIVITTLSKGELNKEILPMRQPVETKGEEIHFWLHIMPYGLFFVLTLHDETHLQGIWKNFWTKRYNKSGLLSP